MLVWMLTYGMVCWAFLLIFFQRDRDGLMANRIVAVPGTFGASMPKEIWKAIGREDLN